MIHRPMHPSAVCGTLLLLACPAALAQLKGLHGPPAGDNSNVCAVQTLARGEVSGWGMSTPYFLGEYLVIRDSSSWQAFWVEHSSLNTPPPEPPYIDFSRQVVIAAIQGPQSTGGGPNISIVRAVRDPLPGPNVPPGATTILIVDDERPGDRDNVSNAYHIVAVPSECVAADASVSFRHVAPVPGTGVLQGRVFVPADATPWRPIPGAVVRLYTSNSAPRISISGHDGSYFFVNVPPGLYLVDADSPPYYSDAVTVEIVADRLIERDFYLVPQ